MRLRRTTARVFPVDPAGRVLLLHGWDPKRPGEPFWFTIGGAIEEGETLRDAAARELREEAGINVDPGQLGEPIASSTIEFSWNGYEIVQEQTFYAVAVDDAEVSLQARTDGSGTPSIPTPGCPRTRPRPAPTRCRRGYLT